MRPGLRTLVLLLPLAMVGRSTIQTPAHWPNDAYVWQRVWTPALVAALHQSADMISSWRVLGAETNAAGVLKPVAIDWNALRAAGKTVIVVIRIDGTLAHWDEESLLSQIGDLIRRWKRQHIEGLELDYDCATARLPEYVRFIRRLRTLADVPARLSVTALPTWIGSARLPELADAVDEIVLQVHGVRAPQDGLFSASEARRWIDAYDGTTTRPFRVAVPDYAVRTVWGAGDELVAVEGETQKLAGGTRARELVAMPREVAGLLETLSLSPPRHLQGLVWFRLPSADDSRTWSAETWRAVIRGDRLHDVLDVVARRGSDPGLSNIFLVNRGMNDSELPPTIGLPAGCMLADGVNGYVLEVRANGMVLKRLQNALLRAHHERTIGWMRCSRGAFDVRT